MILRATKQSIINIKNRLLRRAQTPNHCKLMMHSSQLGSLLCKDGYVVYLMNQTVYVAEQSIASSFADAKLMQVVVALLAMRIAAL
jgi:hypothetical protein